MQRLSYSYLGCGIFQYSTEQWKYAHLAEVNSYFIPSFSNADFFFNLNTRSCYFLEWLAI